jgi:hypothetical protein
MTWSRMHSGKGVSWEFLRDFIGSGRATAISDPAGHRRDLMGGRKRRFPRGNLDPGRKKSGLGQEGLFHLDLGAVMEGIQQDQNPIAGLHIFYKNTGKSLERTLVD